MSPEEDARRDDELFDSAKEELSRMQRRPHRLVENPQVPGIGAENAEFKNCIVRKHCTIAENRQIYDDLADITTQYLPVEKFVDGSKIYRFQPFGEISYLFSFHAFHSER